MNPWRRAETAWWKHTLSRLALCGVLVAGLLYRYAELVSRKAHVEVKILAQGIVAAAMAEFWGS